MSPFNRSLQKSPVILVIPPEKPANKDERVNERASKKKKTIFSLNLTIFSVWQMGKNSHFCLEMGGLSKSVTVMFWRRCVAAFLCQGSKHFITINQPVSDIFAKLIRRPPIHFKTAFKVASLVQLYNLKHYYGVSLNGSTFEVPILSNLVAMAIEQESSLTLEAKKNEEEV